MRTRDLPLVVVLCALAPSAFAGPPFATDDPEPTARGEFEIYAFTTRSTGR